jgi:hypothetical protein
MKERLIIKIFTIKGLYLKYSITICVIWLWVKALRIFGRLEWFFTIYKYAIYEYISYLETVLKFILIAQIVLGSFIMSSAYYKMSIFTL